MLFSRGSSRPRNRIWVSSISGRFFFFLFLIYFTLQYCIGFAIHWHESTTGVHAFPNMNPPSTSLPITSLWVTSPKHALSCIGHRLAIRFLHDSIHVSVPFSQIIPPSPSPSESKSSLYTSVSLLLSHRETENFYFWKRNKKTAFSCHSGWSNQYKCWEDEVAHLWIQFGGRMLTLPTVITSN